MDGMAGVVFVILIGSVATLLYWSQSREHARWWREAAKAAGLTNVDMPEFLGFVSRLTGTAGALKVKIERYQRGKQEHGTRIVVSGFRHGAYELSIVPESLTTSIEKTLGEREVEVGDPEFDTAAYVQGSPALIRAIFDTETRRRMHTLLGGTLHAVGTPGSRTFEHLRVSVSDNELRVDIKSSFTDSTEPWLPAILPQMLDLANRLRRPDDLAGRIAANIRGEALDAVRLVNLRTLTAEFADHSATREALRAALRDDSVDMRLHAALALGSEGREVLLELSSGRSSDEVAARAIAALGTAFPVERAVVRLHEARDAGQEATALACIDLLGASGAAQAVDELIETLASVREGEAAAAARTLGKIGNAAAELPLVAALAHQSGDVRAAAAEALGRLGTPHAVEPLREAASSHLLDGALRRAARHAIAEIQSRVSGASPGQLSLADGQAGEVSLVEEDTRGRLSLGQAAQAQRTEAGR